MIKDKMKIIRYEDENYKEIYDEVVVEFELEIYVNNRPVCSRLCLKKNLQDMVVGFLLTRGYVSRYEDIDKIEMKNFGQSKGKCYCVVNRNRKIPQKHLNKYKIQPEEIVEAMEIFTQKSSLFKKTGGVHSSGILKGNQLIYFADDIGRQNALDKTIGYIVRNEHNMNGIFILFSGRITTEVLDKLLPESIEGIFSKSAVTKDAVLKGKKMGIVLVGFIRGKRFNVYSGFENKKN